MDPLQVNKEMQRSGSFLLSRHHCALLGVFVPVAQRVATVPAGGGDERTERGGS